MVLHRSRIKVFGFSGKLAMTVFVVKNWEGKVD